MCLRDQGPGACRGCGKPGAPQGNLEATVIPATFTEQIPCACTPVLNPTAAPGVGVMTSITQWSSLRVEGTE